MVLDSILAQLGDSDYKIRKEAVLQFAMLLEKSSTVTNYDYTSLLQPELLNVRLTEAEQKEVVTHLVNHLNDQTIRSGLLWAIGKASTEASLDELLKVIQSQYQTWEAESIWQALCALESLLVYEKKGNKYKVAKEIEAKLHQANTVSFLEKALSSNDSRISEAANRLLQIIKLDQTKSGKSSVRI